jgi:hypothetical protein
MIAYILTPFEISLDSLEQIMRRNWVNLARDDINLFLPGYSPSLSGGDSLTIKELTSELALDDWDATDPFVDQLFRNRKLEGESRPFYVNLSTVGISNRLLPQVVRTLRQSRIPVVVITHYGVEFDGDEFLDEVDQRPNWKWEYASPNDADRRNEMESPNE